MEYIQTNLANGRREQTLLSKLTLHYITRISDEEMDLQTKTKNRQIKTPRYNYYRVDNEIKLSTAATRTTIDRRYKSCYLYSASLRGCGLKTRMREAKHDKIIKR